MPTAEVATSHQRRKWTWAKDQNQTRLHWVTPVLHAAVIFYLTGGILPPVIWFTVSWLLILGRPADKGLPRYIWVSASAVALTMLLLFVRLTPTVNRVLLMAGLGIVNGPLVSGSSMLHFTGLSYCFLRSMYGLLDARRWDFVSYARYWFFAPTFISGPILKPSDSARPLREDLRARFEDGAARILSGLFRITAAMVLANGIPLRDEATFASAQQLWPLPLLWLGIFASGLWLFLDFSGYSEVFIGFARICGVRAPENFDRPFAATDLTAFWQRWHITLGDWLRACVYDPLSRTLIRISPQMATAAGITVPILTMLICGAWHGVTKAFLAWGLLHGFGLAVHSAWKGLALPRIPEHVRTHRAYGAASWVATQSFVAAGWVFFLPVTGNVTFLARSHMFAALIGMGR
jgi:D-alanyl-lipoteichoic acid acyltransferase DltB (MBOAT superfamily)